jgi:PAS domain S-box-containing protein
MPVASRWRRWWRHMTPLRQDRVMLLGPLLAVLLFLAAIVSSFAYLRLEEAEREREAVQRDVEYTQQRLRARLLEQQEQFVSLGQALGSAEIDPESFANRAASLNRQYPEVQALTWTDARSVVRASQSQPGSAPGQWRRVGEPLEGEDARQGFGLAQELLQPVFSQPLAPREANRDAASPMLQLHVPLTSNGQFVGGLLVEYSVDALLLQGVPVELISRYAMALLDARSGVLAGTVLPTRDSQAGQVLGRGANSDILEMPVSPVGNGLVLRAQAYRTSLGLVGSGLFWLVCALSALTVWMLIGTWRHTQRRVQAQRALIAETNFRRAMENSMPTGMRAMDLQGRITYVNAAFCLMTGFDEQHLVGRTAPFPYWPDEDREALAARLEDELRGRITPGGFQVRVKRKDGSLFDARMYVSPLIDARGLQTGWMTSMTDITEPNRIRAQLYASYERFTTVLEALDASVSVAPLGSEELLFANKLYRQWFGAISSGHLELSAQAGVPDTSVPGDLGPMLRDGADADPLAGLPADSVISAVSESAEVHVPELGKWLEVRTRYLNWVDGRLAQMVIATDITPRRLAEEQAAAQAERAQSASRLITMGEMASSVAHELNQPLTAISNYCNGMISRIRSQQIEEEDLLLALEKTARQAQRAGQIIQRIRAFVKRSESNRSLAEVSEMVHEAVELADIELRRRNVRLSHYVAARLPRLWVDPILIEQVLVNLLKNAAESVDMAQRPAPRRAVELRVVPRQLEGQSAVEFTVTDSGAGLAPEVMEHLYEAFFSTKTEGMGMGLNLCRTIVESHRGRMQAENIYNAGSVSGCRFTFWIPLEPPSLDGPAEPAATDTPKVAA